MRAPLPQEPGRGRDEGRMLLGAADRPPVEVRNAGGGSRIVLTCEHAGHAVPTSLGGLGIDRAEMDRHIAWDIGAAELALALSRRLDAPLVMQRYTRLVIDCNRPLDAPDAIPTVSDGTEIPVNAELSDRHRDTRYHEIHQPYHNSANSFRGKRRLY